MESTAEDTSRSTYISGMSMRTLRCPWTEEWAGPEAPEPLPAPYQMLLSADYIQASNDHKRADLMTEAAEANCEGSGHSCFAAPIPTFEGYVLDQRGSHRPVSMNRTGK